MRLLHCADLHLDHSFAAEGLPSKVGDGLRAELRSSFEQILATAAGEQVDLLTIGGGLYEQEHATTDTARFLQAAFERLPVPVLIVPGEADPFLPGSIYHLTPWPKTVTVVSHSDWRPQPASGVTLWAAGHGAQQQPPSAPPHLVERAQPHVVIFPSAWAGDDQIVEEAGFAHALASGAPGTSARRTSAGGASLTFGGAPHHTVAILQVDPPAVSADLRAVPAIAFVEQDLDASGLLAEEVRRGLSSWIAGCAPPTVARAQLAGVRRRNWTLDAAAWEGVLSAPRRYLQIVDRTHADRRLSREESQPSLAAEFARRIGAPSPADEAETAVRGRALALGLAALEE